MRTETVTGKYSTDIDSKKYWLLRAAIMSVLPTEGEGMTYKALQAAIEPRVPAKMFPGSAAAKTSMTWYTMTVKLDLQARGLIKHLPKTSPLRYLRIDSSLAPPVASNLTGYE